LKFAEVSGIVEATILEGSISKDSAFKVNDLELRATLRQTQLRRIGIGKRKKTNYYYKSSYHFGRI
jgi:hypothetical protein